MSVYQIEPELEQFVTFSPVNDDENDILMLEGYFDFRGTPRPDWNGGRILTRDVFSDERVIKEKSAGMGDILRFSANSLAFSEKAAELLKPILEASGELLPFEYQGQQWFVHNILNIPAAIDPEKSEYEILDSGKTMFKTRVVDPSKLNDISLFKLKEDNYSTIRCHDVDNKAMDFKYQVEKNGLTGLKFISREA